MVDGIFLFISPATSTATRIKFGTPTVGATIIPRIVRIRLNATETEIGQFVLSAFGHRTETPDATDIVELAKMQQQVLGDPSQQGVSPFATGTRAVAVTFTGTQVEARPSTADGNGKFAFDLVTQPLRAALVPAEVGRAVLAARDRCRAA